MKRDDILHTAYLRGLIPRSILALAAVLLIAILLGGCGHGEEQVKKIRDLDYELITAEQAGGELAQMIEEKKKTPFRFTYQEGGMLYICIGYGEKPSGGYSITVEELMEAENAVYVKTGLIGPGSEDIKVKGTSYPNLIIRTKDIDKVVVFE